MKTNSEICDTIQCIISDKYDSGLALELSEQSHIDGCSDCKQFYDFVHADSFHELATHSVDKAFDLDKVCQTASIMEELQPALAQKKKSNKIIRIASISLATAAAAVVAITSFSQLQPSGQFPSGEDEIVSGKPIGANTAAVHLPALPKIKLEQRCAALNHAVEGRLETVCHGIMKLKACFKEGSEFLDEHTKEANELSPESSFELERTMLPMA